MTPWKRNVLLVIGLLALLVVSAKIAWKASLPYRSARVSAKIRQAIAEDRPQEALKLLLAAKASLSEDDRYSCMVALSWESGYREPEETGDPMGVDQAIDEAQAHGVSPDSVRSWKIEAALRDAFAHPFARKGEGGADKLLTLAYEIARQTPGDSSVALLKGMAGIQTRNWSDCRIALDPARRTFPHSVRLRGMRGMCLFAQGSYDSAVAEIPDFRAMSTQDPWVRGRHIWMTKTFMEWSGAAAIASRGQGAREFQQNLGVCPVLPHADWKRASDGYCQIQALVQPGDTARLCRDAGEWDPVESAPPGKSGRGGEDVRACPEWAMVPPGSGSIGQLTDCVFGGSDTGKAADCPQ